MSGSDLFLYICANLFLLFKRTVYAEVDTFNTVYVTVTVIGVRQSPDPKLIHFSLLLQT